MPAKTAAPVIAYELKDGRPDSPYANVHIYQQYTRYNGETDWQECGHFPFGRAAIKANEKPNAGKATVIQWSEDYGEWYGGDRFEAYTDTIEELAGYSRLAYELWQKIQRVKETYNLAYKYDRLSAFIAAMNRLNIGEIVGIKNEGSYWVDHYEPTDRHTWAK